MIMFLPRLVLPCVMEARRLDMVGELWLVSQIRAGSSSRRSGRGQEKAAEQQKHICPSRSASFVPLSNCSWLVFAYDRPTGTYRYQILSFIDWENLSFPKYDQHGKKTGLVNPHMQRHKSIQSYIYTHIFRYTHEKKINTTQQTTIHATWCKQTNYTLFR